MIPSANGLKKQTSRDQLSAISLLGLLGANDKAPVYSPPVNYITPFSPTQPEDTPNFSIQALAALPESKVGANGLAQVVPWSYHPRPLGELDVEIKILCCGICEHGMALSYISLDALIFSR
jgi:hypothetical protein